MKNILTLRRIAKIKSNKNCKLAEKAMNVMKFNFYNLISYIIQFAERNHTYLCHKYIKVIWQNWHTTLIEKNLRHFEVEKWKKKSSAIIKYDKVANNK